LKIAARIASVPAGTEIKLQIPAGLKFRYNSSFDVSDHVYSKSKYI